MIEIIALLGVSVFATFLALTGFVGGDYADGCRNQFHRLTLPREPEDVRMLTNLKKVLRNPTVDDQTKENLKEAITEELNSRGVRSVV